MSVFNNLKSHYKQGWQNKFKSGGTNNLRVKQTEKKIELLYADCGQSTAVSRLHRTVQNFFCIFANFCELVLLHSLTSPNRRKHAAT